MGGGVCIPVPHFSWLCGCLLIFIIRFVFALYSHIDGGTVNIPQLSL